MLSDYLREQIRRDEHERAYAPVGLQAARLAVTEHRQPELVMTVVRRADGSTTGQIAAGRFRK